MPFVLKSSTVCFDCEAAAKRRAEDCFLPDLDRTPGPALATGSPFTRRPQASPTGGHCHQRPCCRDGQALRVPWARGGGGDAAVKPKFTVAAIWLTGPEQPNRLRGRGSVFMCGIAVAIDWPDAELTVRLLISGILHRGDASDPVVTPRQDSALATRRLR